MKSGLFKKRRLILPGILLLVFLMLFAAPRIARWYLVKNSHDLIGRNISLGRVGINYFTGTLRADDFKIFEEDGKTVFASFSRFKVNIDYLPLFNKEYVVQSVSLDNPFIQVLQDGSNFNFTDLIKSDPSEIKKNTIPSEPAKYILKNIRISGGYVKYTDIPLNHTISLDKLDLKIPGFTWNSDSARLNVDFRFVDGGGLYSNLKINKADSTYLVDLKLDSLNLEIIQPYVKNYLNISGLKGFISNNLSIKGSINSISNLVIRGNNDIYGFEMQDTLGRKIFSFNNLSFGIDTLSTALHRLTIKNVSLSDPFILLELIDSTNNWLALIKSQQLPADTSLIGPDSTNTSGTFSYNIPPLSITGGSLLFTDKTLKYPFEYKIDKLNFTCTNSGESNDRIAFDLSAALNGTGALDLKGILDPGNINNDMDLSIDISQFRMKDVDPYFRHYFGFPVNGGLMNFKTENILRTKSLDSRNTIYFRKFSLAEKMKSETEYKVPLRLAIGILSDKDGIIDLKAPVKIRGEEVKIINLWRIIFRVIGNLFVKAAVSPFNLISGMYNTDPAALQVIRLGLMEISPDAANMKSVDIISDILDKKPQLNADFIYCINEEGASDSLAYIMTVNEFLKNEGNHNADKKNIPDSVLIRFVKERLNISLPDTNPALKNLCTRYIGKAKLSSALDSIRNLQTEFLTGYLNSESGLTPDRFRISTVTPDSIIPVVNYPCFRVFFSAGDEKQGN